MFQDYALFPHLTVAENVAFGLPNRAKRREWAASALERVGLARCADSYPHTLSGGQAQRAACGRSPRSRWSCYWTSRSRGST